MIKVVLALLGVILTSSQAQAAGETVPSLGLSPGASPNTVCIFDKSATRPCVTMGTLDSTAHTFSSTPVAITIGPGGSGTTDFTQSGTGNLRFHLGGPASLWNFQDSSSASIMQLKGGTPDSITTSATINPTPPSVVTGATNLGSAAIFFNNTYTGSWAGNGILGLFAFAQATDQINMTGTPQATALEMINLHLITGGSAVHGNRHVAEFDMDVTSTTGNTAAGGGSFYTALNTKCNGTANDNGTDFVNNAKGFCFGLNPAASLSGTATFWAQVVGEEIDVNAGTGSSVKDKIGLQIVEGDNTIDTVNANRDDVAFSINNGGTGGNAPSGWHYLISFGRQGGYNPCNTSACTLIYATDHGGVMSATNGVDFSNASFTGSAFKSTGFNVDGTGIVTGASYKAGATAGVTCSGAPTASFASTGGIVTHC